MWKSIGVAQNGIGLMGASFIDHHSAEYQRFDHSISEVIETAGQLLHRCNKQKGIPFSSIDKYGTDKIILALAQQFCQVQLSRKV